MNIKFISFLKNLTIYSFTLIVLITGCNKTEVVENHELLSEYPKIDPDYTDIVIPPNIAPLNFIIKEKTNEYYIEIYCANTNKIKLKSKNNKVQIPVKQWKKLLEENKGNDLFINIYFKNENNKWRQYKTITNKIALEKIDSYVAYRNINPGYVFWKNIGIYQRNLENFKETAILTNRATKRNCMNCHSFCGNNPERFMLHMRKDFGGTLIKWNGELKKVDTKTNYTMSAGVYPAWHPEGNHIAFSVNKINQKFHGDPGESIYVSDTYSDLIVYNIKTNTVTTSPNVSTERLENLPNWSPDGKFLYFTSAPVLNKSDYNEVKYDLMRIPYNVNTNEWGTPDTVLTSDEMGKSISFPKISPNGKYLIYTASDYGYFSIHFKSADLCIMDLENNKYRILKNINSDKVDSYCSWSSESNWFVFASKRKDGLCSRLYFSYINNLGETSKPFILPQKNPDFYDSFINNYNVPEMIKGPVKINKLKLLRTVYKEPVKANFDNTVKIDALSGATKITYK